MKFILTFYIFFVFVLLVFVKRGQGYRITGTFIGGRFGYVDSYHGGKDFEARKNYGGRRSFENGRGNIKHLGGYRTVGGYHNKNVRKQKVDILLDLDLE